MFCLCFFFFFFTSCLLSWQDVFSVPSGTSTCTQRGPSVLPAPTPQLPPAFFSSAVNQLNSLDSFSGSGLGTSAATLDILDDLSTSEKGGVADASNLLLTPTKLDGLDSLDSLDDALDKMPRAAEEVIEAKTELDVGEKSLDELLDELDPLETLSNPSSQGDHVSKIRNRSMDRLDSLDSLDSFSSMEGVRVASPAVLVGGSGLDSLSDFNSAGDYDLYLAYYKGCFFAQTSTDIHLYDSHAHLKIFRKAEEQLLFSNNWSGLTILPRD